MNTQEVVETVVKHLFEQGCMAGEMQEQDDGEGGKYEEFFCEYRDSKGHMCAAGKLIRNEDYKKDMEGTSIGVVIDQFGLDYLKPHRRILGRLQQDVHDKAENWESTEAMKGRIKYVLSGVPDIDLSFMSGLSFSDR